MPFPVVLVFKGVNLHSWELVEVEQEPAYTEISPAEDMEGMNAVESLLRNGRLGVIVSRDRFEAEIMEDMFKDKSVCLFESGVCVKIYAMSLFSDEICGRRIEVGLYGSDCKWTMATREDITVQRTEVTWFLMMGVIEWCKDKG